MNKDELIVKLTVECSRLREALKVISEMKIYDEENGTGRNYDQCQHNVPEVPVRVPLSVAECIGVYVRPVKQEGLNFWNLERICIVSIEPVTWARKLMAAVTGRPAEPLALLDWDQVEYLQYFLNEGQAISYAQNMIAQRPNTHQRRVGQVIFGNNRVPEVNK